MTYGFADGGVDEVVVGAEDDVSRGRQFSTAVIRTRLKHMHTYA